MMAPRSDRLFLKRFSNSDELLWSRARLLSKRRSIVTKWHNLVVWIQSQWFFHISDWNLGKSINATWMNFVATSPICTSGWTSLLASTKGIKTSTWHRLSLSFFEASQVLKDEHQSFPDSVPYLFHHGIWYSSTCQGCSCKCYIVYKQGLIADFWNSKTL